MKSFKKVFAIITCMCMLFNFSSFASEKTEGGLENTNVKGSTETVWHLEEGDNDYIYITAFSEDDNAIVRFKIHGYYNGEECSCKDITVYSKILSLENAEDIDTSIYFSVYNTEGECLFSNTISNLSNTTTDYTMNYEYRTYDFLYDSVDHVVLHLDANDASEKVMIYFDK